MDSSVLTNIVQNRTNQATFHRNHLYGANNSGNSGAVIAGMVESRYATVINNHSIMVPITATAPVVLPIVRGINDNIKIQRTYYTRDNIVSATGYILQDLATKGIGPTMVARYLYIWFTSIAFAWSWIHSKDKQRVTGIHDGLDWSSSSYIDMTEEDEYIWMNTVLIFILNSIKIGKGATYTDISGATIYSDSVTNQKTAILGSSNDIRVKNNGNWTEWSNKWNTWYTTRAEDGFIGAQTPPADSVLPNDNSVLNVNGTINIPASGNPRKWVPLQITDSDPLTIKKYLTYNWYSVKSSLDLSSQDTIISNAIRDYFLDASDSDKESARNAEIDVVLKLSEILTDQQKAVAEFWAGGPGTASPPGQFAWFWKEYIAMYKPAIDIVIYSGLDLGIHLFEGSRITWELKKQCMEARPIQEIRTRYADKNVISWKDGKDISGSTWVPFQESNFVTPPFADFPSGHSHFSTAFALTMTTWFGSVIPRGQPRKQFKDLNILSPILNTMYKEIEYGTICIPAHSSVIQPDTSDDTNTAPPNSDIYLTWYTWSAMASGDLSSGFSRFYGGIHARSAHDASEWVAGQMDDLIRSEWGIIKPVI